VPDFICRFGGEEFLLLLPDTSLVEAQNIAERIRHRWQTSPIPTSAGGVSVTVSIGVVEFTQAENENFFDLAERADLALYQAKKLGRNRVESWQRGLRMAHVDGLY
jgi:diguanylate cyclase (GGDEF)-like protein